MIEPEAPRTWAYAAALPITIVCLALANFIIAYLGGQANVEAARLGAVAIGFVQGVAGAVIAGVASSQLLKSHLPADFWLKWIVLVAAALFAIVIAWAMVIGKADKALTWMTFAGVASLIGTEVGRRMAKALGRRPGYEGPADSPS
ncbi:MAG TPA: hypothetical protein VFP12_10125 [Allosphingosinicella sp.]|nr:hypothetical protein [Allosphingosinicella sp.]